MPKASKEARHKQKSSKHGMSPEYKLLNYAALGQYNKLRKLLHKRSHVDVDFYDAQGNTALHEVCTAADFYLHSPWTASVCPTPVISSRASDAVCVIRRQAVLVITRLWLLY